MQLIDTHTHLFTENFENDLDDVVSSALRKGVSHFLLPNIDVDSVEAVQEACRRYPQFHPMWGLHPCHIGTRWKDDLKKIRPLFEAFPACAVGEIGLDFYWSKEFMEEQLLALEEQLNWAVDLKLPVSLHTRESTGEAIGLVKKHTGKGLCGVFHCFSGTREEAEEIIGMGMYLGIGGSLTYPKNPIRNFLADLPPGSLVLETDAPYLPPVPYRGKRNEPAYLMEVVFELAGIFQLSPSRIAEITTANAKRVFNL